MYLHRITQFRRQTDLDLAIFCGGVAKQNLSVDISRFVGRNDDPSRIGDGERRRVHSENALFISCLAGFKVLDTTLLSMTARRKALKLIFLVVMFNRIVSKTLRPAALSYPSDC